MRVSIITVCFNAQDTIEETVKSAVSQTYTDIEYIVVDGASSDNTVSIIKQFQEKIGVFISEPDNGVYEAMNKGVSLATGDIVFFLNSGDVFFNNEVVKNVVEIFRKKDANIVFGDVVVLDPETGFTKVKSHQLADKVFFYHDTICHQAMFAKRSLFENYGAFDTRYRISADYEWLLRVKYGHHAEAMYTSLIISIFRLGGISSNPKYYDTYLSEYKEIKQVYYSYLQSLLCGNKFFRRMFNVSLRIVLMKVRYIWRNGFSSSAK